MLGTYTLTSFGYKKYTGRHDPFIEKEIIIGKLEDNDYVIKNTGKGKLFPCGPECTYNGKIIPCMCQWSKKGSMTGEILKEVVETLYSYQFFDCLDVGGGILPS